MEQGQTIAVERPLVKCTTIGGQALLEGILMRGPERVAIATRKPGEAIVLVTEPVGGLAARRPLFRLPFFRGIASLIDSLQLGTRAIQYAAKQLEEEPEEETVFGRAMQWLFIGGMLLLFLFFPTWSIGWLKPWIASHLLLNLLEGVVRIALFLTYVLLLSRLEELRRVFMYHGAEHKSIACYEHGEALTVENVRKYPRVHPRCGTSFLANLVIFSALFLSLFGWPNPLLRLVLRIVVLPILVGVTYELNRWTGTNTGFFSRMLRAPGLFVQRVATVKEPDDGMIEVAIAALEAVIPEDQEADRWR